MKRILAMLLALVMAFSLVACGNQKDTPNDNDSTNDQQATTNPITLRICMSEVQTDTKCVIVKEVTDRITERTDGRVKFDLYYSDALGSIGEVMEQMSLGGNIMGCTSGEQWAAYGCPDMTALNLMYVGSLKAPLIELERAKNENYQVYWKAHRGNHFGNRSFNHAFLDGI